MKLKQLAQTLEDIKRIDSKGSEYWSARDLFPLLGYQRWESFQNAIDRAKKSSTANGNKISDHFRQVTKVIKAGKTAIHKVDDFELTRLACYLIAMNGSPDKPEIAFAQMYFAMQTRKQEVLDQNIEEIERLISRKRLAETEKEFAKTAYERGVNGRGIGEVRSAGDSALFGGHNTKAMKRRLGVTNKGTLADVLPTVTLKAKDLATEMTTVNTKRKNLYGKTPIKNEHVENNRGVRKALTDANIYPEALPPEENINRVEARQKRLKKVFIGTKPPEIPF